MSRAGQKGDAFGEGRAQARQRRPPDPRFEAFGAARAPPAPLEPFCSGLDDSLRLRRRGDRRGDGDPLTRYPGHRPQQQDEALDAGDGRPLPQAKTFRDLDRIGGQRRGLVGKAMKPLRETLEIGRL